jgi:hypothetical protein
LAEQRESGERQYFEHCRETYLKMRRKYEPEAKRFTQPGPLAGSAARRPLGAG